MSERAHALLSASGAHRWLVCTPSARLEEQLPDTSSDAAHEGTVAHALCETLLRKALHNEPKTKPAYKKAVDRIKADPLYQQEMDRCAEEYVDQVLSSSLQFDSEPVSYVEKTVDFSPWVPEGFGTADCILIGGDTLHLIDFKYGKGVPVSAEDNPQLMLYALGAVNDFRLLYAPEKIRLTIVQPRIDHTNSWDCTIEYLEAFGENVKKIAAVAYEGGGKFNPGEDQCRFCRARSTCRARAEENISLAGFTKLMPPLLTPEEVGGYLKIGEDVAAWLADLKAWALSESLAGHEIAGWKAVEGRGSRDWTDQDAAFQTLISAGTPEAMLYERKPLSLAQIEKVVGKAAFADTVGEYVVKKPGKPTLVKASDKRPAITNTITAADAFGE